MARFTVVIPDSVASWVKKSAKQEGVSQSAFVSNMLTYAMAGITRDIRIMNLEDKDSRTPESDISGPPTSSTKTRENNNVEGWARSKLGEKSWT